MVSSLLTEDIVSQKFFDRFFKDGILLITQLGADMKNKLIPFYDKMMLKKT
ncbi:DDE family transposase [Bacteroides zoogleoformans]|uniref:Transposase DDE domain-containing protein n=1 Tax=Bacteroides zoogleoformans TaxID=28119 RepID=A0ABM6T8Z5_9BACE|nr:transposase [Bacteroides zoogleoformans]AVM53237.1 hypothetical protein C4H11_10115 [Bacteroides zoogleoformans]TWJ17823.1 DDE family transposase [Bacteroides zoogleoformans]